MPKEFFIKGRFVEFVIGWTRTRLVWVNLAISAEQKKLEVFEHRLKEENRLRRKWDESWIDSNFSLTFLLNFWVSSYQHLSFDAPTLNHILLPSRECVEVWREIQNLSGKVATFWVITSPPFPQISLSLLQGVSPSKTTIAPSKSRKQILVLFSLRLFLYPGSSPRLTLLFTRTQISIYSRKRNVNTNNEGKSHFCMHIFQRWCLKGGVE